jgi:GAF domain-containing protein
VDLPEEARLVIEELTGLLLDEETLETTLQRVVDAAVRVASHADAASVSLDRDGERLTFAATDDRAARIDAYQTDTREGPCVDAVRDGTSIRAVLPKDSSKWPTFAARATGAGLCAAYAVPLRVREVVLGSLNVYSFSGEFAQDDEKASEALAAQAAIALSNAQVFARTRALVDDLNVALETRDVIGQAKGILMERHTITADEAFEMLVSASQRHHKKLRDVADALARSGELPPVGPAGA